MERFVVLPGGNNLFEPGLQIAGAIGLEAGSSAVRTLAVICSGWRPAARSVMIVARILPTSSAERGDTCVICVG
jgi:hypothetical protein